MPATVAGDPRWLLGPFGTGLRLDGLDFFVFLVASFVGYLCVVAGARLVPRGVLWGAICAAIALFALAPPLLSQDVFSYISYARLAVDHDLNPYVAVPAAVPSDPAFPFVGWQHATSVYGPLFTLASYPLGLVSVPEALWLVKLLAGASVLGLTVVVARIAPRLGSDPARAAALVALNPLVLVDVVGGAHNDAVMTLLAVGGVALLLLRGEVASGAAVVAGAGLKAAAAVVVPFALLGSKRPRLAAGALAAVGTTVLLAVAVFGLRSLDPLGLAGEATSKHSVPRTIAGLVDLGSVPVRDTALALYVLGLLALVVWTLRGGDWIRATGWAAIGLLLTTGWLMPWYVIWVLPFAALAEDGLLTTATLGLCAFQLVNRVPL